MTMGVMVNIRCKIRWKIFRRPDEFLEMLRKRLVWIGEGNLHFHAIRQVHSRRQRNCPV